MQNDPVINDFLRSASQLTLDQQAIIRGLLGAANADAIPPALDLPLGVSQGGTGGDNPSTARTNLGLGTTNNVQFAGITGTTWTFGNGIVTTSSPVSNLTQTWNESATVFTASVMTIMDTASSGLSLFADYKVGSSSKISLRKDGLITAAAGFTTTAGPYLVSRDIGSARIDGYIAQANTTATAGAPVKNSPSFVWFARAWNTTATAASKNNSVECLLVPTSGATTSATLVFRNVTVDGTANTTDLFTCTTSGLFSINGPVKTAAYTVSTLPTPTTGMRCHVTDATATTFYSTVAGGGANIVPVFYNGTNWVIA